MCVGEVFNLPIGYFIEINVFTKVITLRLKNYYFFFSMHDRENIVLGTNFRYGNFDGFMRFKSP